MPHCNSYYALARDLDDYYRAPDHRHDFRLKFNMAGPVELKGYASENETDDKSLLLNSEVKRRKYCSPFATERFPCFSKILIALLLVVIVVIIVTVGIVLGTKNTRKQIKQEPWINSRLPTTVSPKWYNLSLSVSMEHFTVQGEAEIGAVVSNARTSYIILHALDMNISSAIIRAGGREVTIRDSFFYAPNQFYVISTSEPLSSQFITIQLNFSYKLVDGLSGFYRSSYTTNGTTAYLATTQFEPTDARRAFPCFDEPAFKANFTIHVTHDCHYTAVSNMPMSSISGDTTCGSGGSLTTHFRTSLRMSTYLVAIVVSQFTSHNLLIEGGRIQVCSTTGLLKNNFRAPPPPPPPLAVPGTSCMKYCMLLNVTIH